GQIFQITSSYLSPDSRFCRKQVSSIYTNFNQTGEPEKYQAVWDALAVNVDIATLQQMTQLSKHDVYKILLFFLKKNMLIVDGEQERQQLMSIDEGLAMIEINLKKIQRRPVMYNCYKASAEISADIARIAGDEVVKFAFGVLRRYFLEYFNGRKVLGSTNCEICLQVLVLTSAYIKSGAEKDREELLNYISFSFNIDSENIRLDASIAPQQSELMPTTTLEKIENIDLANDPLDDTIESSTLLEEMDDVLGALDRVLGSALDGGQVIESVSDGQSQFSGLTSAEEEMIRELFDNIALAYVKPLKDFIRELYRSAELQRSVSLEWYELIEPVFTLLSGSSAKMGYQQIADAVKELESSVNLQKVVAESQQSDYFPSDAVYHITVAYQKLAEMQPKTFALLASEEELAEKKEVLLVKFVLKQIPEITEKLLSKILFAGLNTFDKFMQSKPDEIAALTGMSKELAGDVYEKFYQYRNIYYDQGSLEHQRKFIALYELNLRVLREVNIDIESLVMMEKQGDEKVRVDKERLKVERQRALWALFVLLCIKEEYDFIEMIQQSVFDVRIQLLEDYFNRLTSQSQAVYQQVPLDPRLYPNG
ncbi:MAG: helix-hairpin-helix domain-containing protein, partial [Blastocatellia bacterium]|nr:helix-hairpin-helix domain-containing protein [Blastocatellia bacterium]